MSNHSISVCMAVYGAVDVDSLNATVLSAQVQQGVDLEILVAEQSPSPRCSAISRLPGVVYMHRLPDRFKDGKPVYRPGRIRNFALRAARNHWMYLTDADVVFLEPLFLKRLIDISQRRPLFRPPMIRLIRQDVRLFTQDVANVGYLTALKKIRRHGRYIATYGSEPPEIKVREAHGRLTTTDVQSYLRFKENPGLKLLAPTIWSETVHVGGIFASRSQVEAAMYYCERYETWGNEDTDLQWKLRGLYECDHIDNDPTMFVMHLDHDKSYFSPEDFLKNKEIFELRKQGACRLRLSRTRPKMIIMVESSRDLYFLDRTM